MPIDDAYNRHETRADWPTETVANMVGRMMAANPEWAPFGVTRAEIEEDLANLEYVARYGE